MHVYAPAREDPTADDKQRGKDKLYCGSNYYKRSEDKPDDKHLLSLRCPSRAHTLSHRSLRRIRLLARVAKRN